MVVGKAQPKSRQVVLTLEVPSNKNMFIKNCNEKRLRIVVSGASPPTPLCHTVALIGERVFVLNFMSIGVHILHTQFKC